MGGNASPFIADLFLSWQEFCFMEKLVKSGTESDLKLARQLSLNSRYLDDIAVLNYLGFGQVAKLIYHSDLILEESEFGYHYDHFLDLNIRIVKGKFVIGIYHKVDDFNFEVISFPFPSSNIHSQVGYSSFYSQLVRYYRLCNNLNDFIVRVKMLKEKLSNRGYSLSTLQKYFLRFCTFYPAPLKYGPDDVSLWELTRGNNAFGGSCCVYDQDAVETLIKPCTVRLENLYIKNKEPCEVDVRVASNSESHNLSVHHNEVQVSFPIPIPLMNPTNYCYLNSILQVLFRYKDILFIDNFVNNNPEGLLVSSLFISLQSGSEFEMDKIKTNLSNYNQFFDGSVQRDAYECFLRILDVIHKGTKRSILGSDSSLAESDEFMTSITRSHFSFILKKTLTCLICNRSSVFSIPSSDINVYPSSLKSLEFLIFETMTSTLHKGCTCSGIDTEHSELLEFEELPRLLFVMVKRYSFNSIVRKNSSFIIINDEIKINGQVYDHSATIYHHGETTSSGHYTSKILYTNAAYICDDLKVSVVDSIKNEQSKSCYLIVYLRRD